MQAKQKNPRGEALSIMCHSVHFRATDMGGCSPFFEQKTAKLPKLSKIGGSSEILE